MLFKSFEEMAKAGVEGTINLKSPIGVKRDEEGKVVGRFYRIESDSVNPDENATSEESLASNKYTCCICGMTFKGFGNNPYPYEGDACCDYCNWKFVIPARTPTMSEKSF